VGANDNRFRLDPELAKHAARLEPIDLSAANLADLRARTNAASRSQSERWPDVEQQDHEVPASGSASGTSRPAVSLRIYRRIDTDDQPDWPDQPTQARRSEPSPAVLEIHGGGHVLGDLAMMDVWCQAIASMTQSVVVSVDYRLSPEHPFPAALEDCYRTLEWMAEHHADLGIDPSRIVVSGQSAGAGLAAGVCLAARDRGGPGICYQMLEVPQLDDRLQTTSAQQCRDAPVWTTQNARDSWRHYLGPEGPPPGQPELSYAIPARAATVAGVPPAYVSVMQFDPMRDEAINYAQRLMDAGIPVELHSFAGTFHSAARVATAEVAKRIALESITVLRRVLHHVPPAPLNGADDSAPN